MTRIAVVAVVVMAVGVSACGRKGPLGPPPGTSASAAGYHAAAHPHDPAVPIKNDKPFFLDFLL